MSLKQFTKKNNDEYHCRISTTDGDTLFEAVVSSNVTSQTLEVLKFAIDPPGRRHQKNLTRSSFTISKSLGSHHSTRSLGLGNDSSLHTLELCVRILAPNSGDLSGSIGFSRGDFLSVCAPETISKVADPFSPRDFYDVRAFSESSKNDAEFKIGDRIFMCQRAMVPLRIFHQSISCSVSYILSRKELCGGYFNEKE